MIVFPFWLLTAFLALMLKWTLNLSAFVLALPIQNTKIIQSSPKSEPHKRSSCTYHQNQ